MLREHLVRHPLAAVSDNLADELIFLGSDALYPAFFCACPVWDTWALRSAGYAKTFDVLTRYGRYDFEILVDM